MTATPCAGLHHVAFVGLWFLLFLLFLWFLLFIPGPRSPRGAVPGVAYSLPFVQHSAPETRAVAHVTPV